VTVVREGAPMYWDFVDDSRLLVHSGTVGPDGFLGEVRVDGAPFEGTQRSGGVFRSPSVSFDDRFVAYLAPGDGAIGEVVRESRDGSGTTRTRVFGPAAMSFSPVSDQLAFLAPDQPTSSPLPLPVGPLRLLDPDAAGPRTLLGGSVVAYFWSPTGKQIAVLRLEDRDDPVVEAGLDGGVILARAPLRASETAAGLALRLSFVTVADGTLRSERVVRVSDLFVNQVLPFFDQYALSHRFWSPDGTVIALPVVGDGDVTEVQVIPADGSQPVVAATAEIGFWSP
jgi:TolB protein